MKNSKILMSFFILVVLFFPASSFAEPQDTSGWGKTKWGMTKEQLEGIYGSELDSLSKEKEYSNTYCDKILNNYKIIGYDFTVEFCFLNSTDKLNKINIVRRGSDSGVVFHHLQKSLIEKYGMPSKEFVDMSLGKRIARVWILPSTIIQLNENRIFSIGLHSVNLEYNERRLNDDL
jgi:hypothetical protein